MLFTFADLEDRRKAEMALGRSEERFAKAFRLSPIPTMVETIDGHRFVDVNDAFVRSLGYRVEEVVTEVATPPAPAAIPAPKVPPPVEEDDDDLVPLSGLFPDY